MIRRLAPLLLLLAFCHREQQKPAPPKPAAHESWERLPSRDKYAGSDSCRDCHQKNYDRWTRDWHSRALSKAETPFVAGRFDNAHFKGDSSEAFMSHRLSRRDDAYVMRTRNREGQLLDYNVEWVIGGKRMQDAVTVFDDGRWQVLPVYYHVTGHGDWVDYNEAKQGKVGPDHPHFWTNFKRTVNKECLECHATGVDVRYDRATHAWSTTLADSGVACEACHGPGARHAETKAKGDIFRPSKSDMSVCGRCHGPHEPLFPLLAANEQFRPGERYDDRYQALVITDGTERSGEFFADGRPSSSSFEYQALSQSRCKSMCLDCHTAPHQDHGPDEVAFDRGCSTCHKTIDASHSHHQKVACVDCHMPKLVSGVLDKFPDHAIDIPNPNNTIRHDVPNACTNCHEDKPPAAMQQAIEAWWPNAVARQSRRTRLADAIDEKTRSASLEPLTAVIRDTTEAPSLRGACAVLLAQRFPGDASRVLVPLLHDPNQLVRAKFIEALGYAHTGDTIEPIAALINDPSIQVRELAALVLASLGDRRGLDALEKLAADPKTRALFRPHVMLAIDAANRGDYDRATRELDFAVDEVPYAVDALVMLGDIAARRGDFVKARSWFGEALRFDPSHRGALARLAALNGSHR